MDRGDQAAAPTPPTATAPARARAGSWVPLVGSACILLVMLLLVLLASLLGDDRPESPGLAPTPPAATDS